MSSIYLPGRGMLSAAARDVDTVVNRYDERLYFKQNPATGQWCIYTKMPHGEEDLPLLGWDAVPSTAAALTRLFLADSLRHREQILVDMDRRREEFLQPFEAAADDSAGEAAEALEWATRKMDAHPSPRVFVPRGV